MPSIRNLVSVIVLVSCFGAGGCSSNDTPAGDPCKGGVIRNGVCEAKCNPAKCLEGNTCVNNACVLVCASHLDCLPDGSQSCQAAVEDGSGKAINICGPSNKPAGLGVRCPNGNECAEGLRCITTGVGDAEAYCTNDDCKVDGDCGAGFYCGISRDPHAVCGSSTIKGTNTLCGKTTEPCIDPAKLTDGGKTLFEGSACLLRHTCLKRTDCTPCSNDLDCSRESGQRCSTVGGGKVCLHACAKDGDCQPDAQCADGSCVPRAGACKGTGKLCDPCVNDEDCGTKGTRVACVNVDTAMRACLDLSFPTPCTTDADCPVVASGKHPTCLDERLGVDPANSVYHHCYLPTDTTTNKASCW